MGGNMTDKMASAADLLRTARTGLKETVLPECSDDTRLAVLMAMKAMEHVSHDLAVWQQVETAEAALLAAAQTATMQECCAKIRSGGLDGQAETHAALARIAELHSQ